MVSRDLKSKPPIQDKTHWFDSELQTLYKLAEAYDTSKVNNDDESLDKVRQTRSDFIEAVQSLVDSVVKSPGVTGCLTCHDGLILAKAGIVSDIDALGALIQESIRIAQRSENFLALGVIQQIVIVGETNKVAMICVGPLTLCILSPKDTSLAETLSQSHTTE